MTEVPPVNCPHCNGPIKVRLAQVFVGQISSWRTGINIYPNWQDEQNHELYDKAWCTDCQTMFFVEGR